jgi:pyruvate carboxylase
MAAAQATMALSGAMRTPLATPSARPMRAAALVSKKTSASKLLVRARRSALRVGQDRRTGVRVTATTSEGETAKAMDGSDEERISRAIQISGGANNKAFRKVLCANRGEIAVRVFRAASELGARTVAVYSPPDRLQPHRYKADESYCVGEGMDITPVECYLAVKEIVKIAKEHGVEAIHPGYGFLSERADFARECEKAGIAFVGPRAEVLDVMGDKTAARGIAIECGVPVIPGTEDAVKTLEEAQEFCETSGFPIIMKAAMGGGGRGMRVVRSKEELPDLFNRATSEAAAAFGDGRVFIEKFIGKPRHIEVQILADSYGNVVHLYDRDCSVQRRHQKVIEMAPALKLPEETRQAIFADAIKLCKHINYKNAGTVEFLVDEDGTHYFIEVNPRVQVEHTVTEEVTGIDIVQSQLRIAAGASLAELGITCQEDVTCSGVAIQTRITTEDPTMNFQPNVGRLEVYRCPGGMGVRIDSAMSVGTQISPHYDSLLTKLTCKASNFQQAVQKLYRCLCEFRVRGVKTNISFLQNVLCAPEFLDSTIDTNYIDGNTSLFMLPDDRDPATKMLTYLAEMVVNGPNHPGAVGLPPLKTTVKIPQVPAGAKKDFPGWRQVLIEKGPVAFARAIRAHEGMLITDTTWRDAHQSLLATRMRTIDMEAVADYTSYALNDAFSIEMWGGATFDVSMRFLHECPWDRLDRLRAKVPNVPFQMLLRGTNAVGYTTYPDNVVKAFVAEAKDRGIDIFRVFDSLNYIENLKFGIEAVHEAGGVVEAVMCYTGDVSDPTKTKYDVDYYVNYVTELVECDIHILAIKDMAGLLKPEAARMLVGAIRKKFPDLPIHVHTHDTAGVGVATYLACMEAGADIVDGAIDSMSGLTSQPSLGALLVSGAGNRLDTGLKLDEILPLVSYWEQVRGLYQPYECNLRSGTSDVYTHEMPGGQYTNLKFQSSTMGLADQWDKVKVGYAEANRVLGDIVKVTPSSKVVGDLAQFMVANDLDEKSFNEQAETLSLPDSVIEFFQGYIGQPYGGFPEVQKKVLKGKPVIEGRPGVDMPDLDLAVLRQVLATKFNRKISVSDALSSAMYPKVFDEFTVFQQQYGDLTTLPTGPFLQPLETDEEVEVILDKGQSFYITYKAKGELKPDGMREVFFELNGIPRQVEVFDKVELETAASSGRAVTERADATVLGSVGAPMAGKVTEVMVQSGQTVTAGQSLAVMSAMKMETTVAAPCGGVVSVVNAVSGDTLKAGDLLVLIDESASSGALPESLTGVSA